MIPGLTETTAPTQVNVTDSVAPIHIYDWGCTTYNDALLRQHDLVDQRLAGTINDTLVFTEHSPVYTIGRRKNAVQNLLWDQSKLDSEMIEVVNTNRGGDITYHGPGQIVGYAIVSLHNKRDLHAYLRNLETIVIRTLTAFGLKTSRRSEKTGIWLDTRKICAIGVAVRKWVTYHGFALNVAPELNHFAGIIPCGIMDGSVTSMEKELGHGINGKMVKNRLAVEFKTVFQNSISTHG